MSEPQEPTLSDSLAAQASLLSELLSGFLEPALARAGLDQRTFEILSTIHASGEDASQAQIARRLGITPPSFTESLRIVVGQGLATQESGTDARKKYVRLTSKGKTALKESLKAVNSAEQKMVEGMSGEELRVAIGALRKANRNLAMASRSSNQK